MNQYSNGWIPLLPFLLASSLSWQDHKVSKILPRYLFQRQHLNLFFAIMRLKLEGLRKNAGYRVPRAGLLNQISWSILIEKLCQLTVVKWGNFTSSYVYRIVIYCEIKTLSNQLHGFELIFFFFFYFKNQLWQIRVKECFHNGHFIQRKYPVIQQKFNATCWEAFL